MARSRNYQKSRKCYDICSERMRLRRMRDMTMDQDVEEVLEEKLYKMEPQEHVPENRVHRTWLQEQNLLVMLMGETAHTMPARG